MIKLCAILLLISVLAIECMEHEEMDQVGGEVEVTFYYYTRAKRNGVRLRGDKLPSNFDRSRTTYVTLHGMGSSYKSPCQKALRKALLNRYNANVIVPDYTAASNRYTLTYEEVARRVGNFLANGGIDGRKTRVIGLSLGAQVAGVLSTYSGFRPSHIYGLDPAGPIFEGMPENQRLSTQSADYVQVIHTNPGGAGIAFPIGNDDVYVNGGNDYPCCSTDGCRHTGSCDVFQQTIQAGPMEGRLCDSLDEARSSSCRGQPHQVGFAPSHARSGNRISYLRLDQCFELTG